MSGKTAVGPVQLGERSGLRRFQLERAQAAGLIPPPDRAGGKWSAAAADDVVARAERIRSEVGSVSDVGAGRAAEILTERMWIDVPADTIPELARRGVLPVVGDYKGCALYCGRALERFTDRKLLDEAIRSGELFTADGAAAVLNVRRADFDHLVRAGLAEPIAWGRTMWQARRSAPQVPLYRAGDLRELAKRTDIDWAAVRSTPKGGRSPLADLPTKENA